MRDSQSFRRNPNQRQENTDCFLHFVERPFIAQIHVDQQYSSPTIQNNSMAVSKKRVMSQLSAQHPSYPYNGSNRNRVCVCRGVSGSAVG